MTGSDVSGNFKDHLDYNFYSATCGAGTEYNCGCTHTGDDTFMPPFTVVGAYFAPYDPSDYSLGLHQSGGFHSYFIACEAADVVSG